MPDRSGSAGCTPRYSYADADVDQVGQESAVAAAAVDERAAAPAPRLYLTLPRTARTVPVRSRSRA
ncbi:hypothetical protein ACFYXS_26335 [Streptomyces sp. NPDC002574]|uniref:hypothetical protein n=1 Tax=Streptomyces sp. NPDC002574 TaxID=3364652 RepID=UPI00367D15D2